MSPDPVSPTVYTVEIPADESEAVAENNTRSVLVNPAGGGGGSSSLKARRDSSTASCSAPGRAIPPSRSMRSAAKGRMREGQDTFFVQAAAERTAALTRGFPARREDLYAYDGIDPGQRRGRFPHARAVGDGGRFRRGTRRRAPGRRARDRSRRAGPGGHAARGGAAGRPETMRRGALVPMPSGAGPGGNCNKMIVTDREGEAIRRCASAGRRRTRGGYGPRCRRWRRRAVGGPRPGATVLAVDVIGSPASFYPVVAVQRYGRGRSMIFAGEASWRWKMLLPSADRSFEFFWRQAARWLAGAVADPSRITAAGKRRWATSSRSNSRCAMPCLRRSAMPRSKPR